MKKNEMLELSKKNWAEILPHISLENNVLFLSYVFFLLFSRPETYQSDKWLRQNRNYYRTFLYLRRKTTAYNKMAGIWQRSQPSKCAQPRILA